MTCRFCNKEKGPKKKKKQEGGGNDHVVVMNRKFRNSEIEAILSLFPLLYIGNGSSSACPLHLIGKQFTFSSFFIPSQRSVRDDSAWNWIALLLL